MLRLLDAQGDEFEVVVIQRDGERCRTCGRVVRVREKASRYREKIQRSDGVIVPAGLPFLRCRDCLYAEPLNQHNRSWRKDASADGASSGGA